MFNLQAQKTEACMTISEAAKEFITAKDDDMINVVLQEAAKSAFKFLDGLDELLAASTSVMSIGLALDNFDEALSYLEFLYETTSNPEDGPNIEEVNYLESCLALESVEKG